MEATQKTAVGDILAMLKGFYHTLILSPISGGIPAHQTPNQEQMMACGNIVSADHSILFLFS